MQTIKTTGKKILSFFMLTVMVITIFAAAVPAASAASLTTSDNGVNFIKQYEGFLKYKVWDYSQYSIGYGSRCEAYEYPNGITEAEAVVLLKKALSTSENAVNKFLNKYNVSVNQNQFDALVSFTYNVGNVWGMSDTFTLRNYILDGISNHSAADFRYAFSLWCKAGGQVLEGLVRRREAEANMFNTPVSYTIAYNANGGSGAPGTSYKAHGLTINLSSTVPVRDGYDFLGWSVDSSASSVNYAPGAAYSADSNTTLYAVWRRKFTISFNGAGGSGIPSDIIKSAGSDVTISYTVPVKDGYKFMGWAVAPHLSEVVYASGSVYSVDADAVLYAVWAKTYQVKYNANGGENAPADTIKVEKIDARLSSAKPTRLGYSFIGWARSADAAKADYTAGSAYTADAGTTLYAVWERNVSIALHTNGGTFKDYDISLLGDFNQDGVIDEYDLSLFRSLESGQLGSSNDLLPYADLNLDGSIDALDFLIIEDYAAGKINYLPAKSVPAGTTTINSLPVPEKDGQFFCGWLKYDSINSNTNTDNINGSSSGNGSSDSIQNNDNTLYASWSDSPLAGDMNFDGNLSVVDVVALRSSIMNGGEVSGALFTASDVNADNSIDVNDVVALRKIIV